MLRSLCAPLALLYNALRLSAGAELETGRVKLKATILQREVDSMHCQMQPSQLLELLTRTRSSVAIVDGDSSLLVTIGINHATSDTISLWLLESEHHVRSYFEATGQAGRTMCYSELVQFAQVEGLCIVDHDQTAEWSLRPLGGDGPRVDSTTPAVLMDVSGGDVPDVPAITDPSNKVQIVDLSRYDGGTTDEESNWDDTEPLFNQGYGRQQNFVELWQENLQSTEWRNAFRVLVTCHLEAVGFHADGTPRLSDMQWVLEKDIGRRTLPYVLPPELHFMDTLVQNHRDYIWNAEQSEDDQGTYTEDWDLLELLRDRVQLLTPFMGTPAFYSAFGGMRLRTEWMDLPISRIWRAELAKALDKWPLALETNNIEPHGFVDPLFRHIERFVLRHLKVLTEDPDLTNITLPDQRSLVVLVNRAHRHQDMDVMTECEDGGDYNARRGDLLMRSSDSWKRRHVNMTPDIMPHLLHQNAYRNFYYVWENSCEQGARLFWLNWLTNVVREHPEKFREIRKNQLPASLWMVDCLAREHIDFLCGPPDPTVPSEDVYRIVIQRAWRMREADWFPDSERAQNGPFMMINRYPTTMDVRQLMVTGQPALLSCNKGPLDAATLSMRYTVRLSQLLGTDRADRSCWAAAFLYHALRWGHPRLTHRSAGYYRDKLNLVQRYRSRVEAKETTTAVSYAEQVAFTNYFNKGVILVNYETKTYQVLQSVVGIKKAPH